MNDQQELVRALEDLAAAAPDGVGLIEAARTVGARRRRRRTTFQALGATAIALILAAGVYTSLPYVRGSGRPGASPSGTLFSVSPSPEFAYDPDRPITPLPWPTTKVAAYRPPAQSTLRLAPDPTWQLLGSGAGASGSSLQVGTKADDSMMAQVDVVDDGGPFNPAAMMAGERITVSGHAAYYNPDLEVWLPSAAPDGWNHLQVRAIGWQESHGAWVIVYTETGVTKPGTPLSREQLTTVAGLVRLGAPHFLASPIRFTYVPPGFPLIGANMSNELSQQAWANLSFGPTRPLSDDRVVGDRGRSGDSINVSIQERVPDSIGFTVRPGVTPIVVNGLTVWIDRNVANVESETCAMTIDWTSPAVTAAQIERMIEEAHLADCHARTTWGDPVS